MLSLKKFIDKIPKDWFPYSKEVEEIDSKKLVGLYSQMGCHISDHERNNILRIKLSQDLFPYASLENVIIACHCMNFIGIFDDEVDHATQKHIDIAKETISKFERIFGQQLVISGSFTPIEELAMFSNQNINEICSNRPILLNVFRSYLIDECHSVIPFNQMKTLSGRKELELYYSLRCSNVGGGFYLHLGLIVSNCIDTVMYIDPLWRRYTHSFAIIAGLLNDVFSYDKEVRAGDGSMNPFYFVQMDRNISKADCLEIMEKELDAAVKNLLNIECQLIERYKSTFKNEEESKQLYKVFETSKTALSGYMKSLCNLNRYKSVNPTFIELQLNPEQ